MFRWYYQASFCYVYLNNITGKDDIASSRWFSRGWTLQELIAPKTVIFYNQTWEQLGTKKSLCESLAAITGIDAPVLEGKQHLGACSIAKRMSWASSRETTRLGDRAYSAVWRRDQSIYTAAGSNYEPIGRSLFVCMDIFSSAKLLLVSPSERHSWSTCSHSIRVRTCTKHQSSLRSWPCIAVLHDEQRFAHQIAAAAHACLF